MASNESAQRTCATLASEATNRLFEAYGMTLTPVAPSELPGNPLLMCGVIGFTGPKVRGTIILAADEKPLVASNPAPGSRLRDWIAELTNQLAGRLKNRLLAHGAEIYITTPVVLRGEHLAPVPREDLEPDAYLAHGGGVVCVWTEVEAAPDVELVEVASDVDTNIEEGASLMF